MTLLPLTPEQNNILCEMAKYAIEHCDEVDIPLEHFIHEGVYYRTCFVPKDVAIIGALVKIPTTVIVSGNCYVTLGNTVGRLEGYHVIKAEAGRRQAFRAITDTYITMCFRTDSKDVKEAEKEFTDEWVLLTTNREELLKNE